MMNIFRRLRWQLTFSYIVVTVCALLVITLVLGAIILPRIFLPDVLTPEGAINQLMQESYYVWSPILSETPVNTTLIYGLIHTGSTSTNWNDFLRVGDIQFSVRTLASVRILILGTDKTLYGHAGGFFPQNYIVGRTISIGENSGLYAPFNAAIAGEKDPKRLFTEVPDLNQLTMAIPVYSNVTGHEDQVVGVLALFIDSWPSRRDIPRHALIIIGRFILIFLFAAAVMGTVFGVLTATSLTKRFNRLSKATERWSKGDFSSFIEDKTGDEIAQFAKKLDDMARQTQNLMQRRQEMAVSEERNRLARDLHDSAKQQALAASFELGTTLTLFDSDPKSAKRHLIEADNLVDSVRKELTNLVHELRPQSMEGQGFSEILNDYVVDWSQRSGIEMEIQNNIDSEEKLTLETKEILLRIVQEGLANIARHSSAKKAEIIVETSADTINLVIQDDGKGFDPGAHHTGMGLRSMRERTEIIGGKFTLDTAPGHGTKITIVLPLDNSRRSTDG